MLYSLYVKNLALIDELELDFTDGLNILTGETGAGKSMLIGSINLALGEKSDASMIRDGAESALIEMTFGDLDEETMEIIRAMELSTEDDGQLVLQRRLYPARSVCKVCGETVTLKQLRELARYLISIHGQNDQQILKARRTQADILDAFFGEKTAPVREKMKKTFLALGEKKKEREENATDEASRKREADLIAYEIGEIDAANLKEGEDEVLEETFRRLSSAQKITESLAASYAAIDEAEGGALQAVAHAYRKVNDCVRYDDTLQAICTQLSDAESLMRDVSYEIREKLATYEEEGNNVEEIGDRLNLINRLKDKYDAHTGGIGAILDYRDQRAERLETLADYETYIQKLDEEIGHLEEEAALVAAKLTTLRRKAAAALSEKLTGALKDLNFEDVLLQITVEDDPARLSSNGWDSVSFLISLNPGEKPRPLEKIASGGELSRIMLGLMTVFADSDEHLAMIFDEIDAGISGRTAWKVSAKLMTIACSRQVICITHLAQIAAMADTHFMIYKETSSGRSITRIKTLDEEDKISELARLIGTDEVSDSALNGARQMRKEALEIKAKEKDKSCS